MNTLQVSTTLLSAFAWTYWTFIQDIFTGKQILQLYYTKSSTLNMSTPNLPQQTSYMYDVGLRKVLLKTVMFLTSKIYYISSCSHNSQFMI